MEGEPVPTVFRDDRWLVVPVDGGRFPKRCVKTNVPVKQPNYAFTADLMPGQIQKPKSSGTGFLDAMAHTDVGKGARVAY